MGFRDDIPCVYGPPVDRSYYEPEPYVPPAVTTTTIVIGEKSHIDSVFLEMIIKLSETVALTKEMIEIINEARNKLTK